jgi:glycerol-3-phosphate dehydrogenase
LEKLSQHVPAFPKVRETSALDALPDLPTDLPVEPNLAMDWLARYGESSLDFLAASKPDERAPLQSGDTPSLADLRWVMCHESVRHLDDLLLRRTRIGLTRREGGAALLPGIRPVVQEELHWTDSQWDEESARYLAYWEKTYRVPHLT